MLDETERRLYTLVGFSMLSPNIKDSKRDSPTALRASLDAIVLVSLWNSLLRWTATDWG